MRRAFAASLLLATPLVGGELARAGQPRNAAADVRDPAPVTVVLHRGGGRVHGGADDPENLQSGVVARSGYSYVDIPTWARSDEEWSELVSCVQTHYADFAVDVVDVAPERGDYILAIVGGSSFDLGFDETVQGISPWNGKVLDGAVLFVFDSPHASITKICGTTAHEVGHALGLDHSHNCSDVMSYESCGPRSFVDEASLCGEWENRLCASGRITQNSRAELARRVGRRG